MNPVGAWRKLWASKEATVSAYVKRVEANLEGVHFFSPGSAPGCDDCFGHLEDPSKPTDGDRDSAEDGSFSNYSCDSCGRSIAGQRHPAHGIIADSEEEAQGGAVDHFDICQDCVHFHAYGDTPADEDIEEDDDE